MLVKLISWNVNGLRALAQKPEWDWLKGTDAQIVGLQETKATPEHLSEDIMNWPGWQSFWDSSSVRKGYSGVAAFTRLEPLEVTAELPDPRYKGEGRLLHLEYNKFHFFNGYFPNGGAAELDENGKPTGEFRRVPYKLGFLDEFMALAVACAQKKPVIVCGDFNIAHTELDLARAGEREHISGFLPRERAWMDRFVAAGFTDTFRYVKGPVAGQYTWWSYQGFARKKNDGWRLDYFFVSNDLVPAIRDVHIYGDVKGSDHCPVGLEVDI